ncbi:MAG TPA: NAD-dependent malic enzyme [Dehalococcoidia bacterium]|nr:NAD-dependent malic enzyme [Dehalococcoidia bacterium]
MKGEEQRGAYIFTIRAGWPNQVGMLGRVTSAIGEAGGDIGAIDIIEAAGGRMVRDLTISARDVEHSHGILEKVRRITKVKVIQVADRAFQLHLGGKIEVCTKVSIRNRETLAMVYTPGVARVSLGIKDDHATAWNLTIKKNAVAVVTDGTAVLGLGDVGPLAALPVMEGKAMLFKELAGVDAWPICLDTKDPEEIIRAVKWIAPGFGGINLEDISSPRCFEIEERLRQELDIPVFHDDQHGTAVVILAALVNAVKIVGKRLEDLRVVISGVGSAGIASARLLMEVGVKDIVCCDRTGVVCRERAENMNPPKRWIAENTNPRGVRGTLGDAMEGADFFLGVSGPGVLSVDDLKVMARDPIVFAMANPVPEIMPEEAAPYVRIMATGRSDYANQVNNALCFPGFFRGLLDTRVREINSEMKIAAAQAIASAVTEHQLHEDYIIPSIFNRTVVHLVARAVAKAAYKTGQARKRQPSFRYSQLYWEPHGG